MSRTWAAILVLATGTSLIVAAQGSGVNRSTAAIFRQMYSTCTTGQILTAAASPTGTACANPAPLNGTYVTQTANSTLSAEQALSTLATGLVNVATGTGVLTSFAPTDDNILIGNGTLWQLKAINNCTGANQALTYVTTTNSFGCVTIGSGAVATTTSILRGDNAGNAIATTVTSADVDTSIALTGIDISTSYAVTSTHLSSALPQSQGGTGVTSITPASSGTRYLCISTAGVITSSASACSGT